MLRASPLRPVHSGAPPSRLVPPRPPTPLSRSLEKLVHLAASTAELSLLHARYGMRHTPCTHRPVRCPVRSAHTVYTPVAQEPTREGWTVPPTDKPRAREGGGRAVPPASAQQYSPAAQALVQEGHTCMIPSKGPCSHQHPGVAHHTTPGRDAPTAAPRMVQLCAQSLPASRGAVPLCSTQRSRR